MQQEPSPAIEVPIRSLLPSDSPRLAGESAENVRMLADLDRPLPPLLVHGPTGRVIDGMHRLRAAELRGDETIRVQYCDGDDDDAFIQSVVSNVRHGLPLTMADRKAAAARILQARPHWSDRKIAAVVALSDKTVAGVRRAQCSRVVAVRVGRDGRHRPAGPSEPRDRVARLISENPGASLRQIAKRAGVSPETVRSVRARLTAQQMSAPPVVQPLTQHAQRDPLECLRTLTRDPALRATDPGRALLRALHTLAVIGRGPADLIEVVPGHDLDLFHSVAQANADAWRILADLAGRRVAA